MNRLYSCCLKDSLLKKLKLRYSYNLTAMANTIDMKFLLNINQIRYFHNTIPIRSGRKGGSKALESSPRKLSKKQVKRNEFKMETRILKKTNDPKKNRIKAEYLKKQLNSPKFVEYMDKIDKGLNNSLKEMLLPENDTLGLSSSDNNNNNSEKDLLSDIDKTLNRLQKLKLIKQRFANELIIDTGCESNNNNNNNNQLSNEQNLSNVDIQLNNNNNNYNNNALLPFHNKVSTKKANRAIQFLDNYAKAKEVYELMKYLKIDISQDSYRSLMSLATRSRMFQEADNIFDELLSTGITPTKDTWSVKVSNVARRDDPDKALALVDQLLKSGIEPTSLMFNSILKALLEQKRYEDVDALWLRMHSEVGLVLDKYSFSVMIKLCAKVGKCEKAFFYYDEMKSLKIEPDEVIFVNLFNACSTAPHWVNGYHDIIFDAMSSMEGNEIIPTVAIYNSIIYAFARAGDSVAAEYYFWEMKRKGLEPDRLTYTNLLEGYLRAQSIGAKTYGSKGRYSKPKIKPTEDEKDYLALGPERVSEISVSSDYNPVPGKRVKPILYDVADESPDGEQEITEIIQREVRLLKNENKNKDEIDLKELLEKDEEEIDFEELARNDPELKKLMDELKMSNPELLSNIIDEVNEEVVVDVTNNEMNEKLLSDPLFADKTTTTTKRSTITDESLLAKDILMNSNEFTDPFIHMKSAKGILTIKGSSNIENNSILQLLDGAKAKEFGNTEITDEYISNQWDLVNFGRAPDTDYHTTSLNIRRKQNIKRAEMAFNDMTTRGVTPSDVCFSKLIAVHSEAVHVEDALNMLEKLKVKFNFKPVELTYRYLIRMYVVNKDIDSAIHLKEQMISENFIPHCDSYGLIIDSYARRDMIVEALKLVEESKSKSITIPDKFLKVLRGRCSNLNVNHPDIPEDPNKWAKDVKETRRRMKNVSDRKVESIKSAMYS